ncbi:MAG: hypothetical protein Q8862_02165 [Bacteroidota bacterium]|nr:hypothetical protein [Bacteroidota bacterium]MDP4205419.1 hypothetical protein [Bacteroidota bacterium]
MNTENRKKDQIFQILSEKETVKQQVFNASRQSFALLKKTLKDLVAEYNNELKDKLDTDQLIPVYSDLGPFEAEIRVAADVLIFSLHTNIFEFDRDHVIWKTDYLKSDINNSYSGVISVYNFLADSFKYNRTDDLGYLIARIFVNRENRYVVEGKRQGRKRHFSSVPLGQEEWRMIIENALLYTLQFDLLIPPYDQVKIASVDLMEQKISHSKVLTGKRLGFRFNSDDV